MNQYIVIAAVVLSTSAQASNDAVVRPEDLTAHNIGPWQIATLKADPAGEKLMIIGRDRWGSIGLTQWGGDPGPTIHITGPGGNDPSGGVTVVDSDQDGVFDVIQIRSDKPNFDIQEIRLVEGRWVMKSVRDWGAPYILTPANKQPKPTP